LLFILKVTHRVQGPLPYWSPRSSEGAVSLRQLAFLSLSYSLGRQVGVDTAGNVYMAGPFRGTAQFANVRLSAQTDMADIYLSKYTPQG
jgi:hypothetical protein